MTPHNLLLQYSTMSYGLSWRETLYQTQVFTVLYNSDDNVLVAAPTGSGKISNDSTWCCPVKISRLDNLPIYREFPRRNEFRKRVTGRDFQLCCSMFTTSSYMIYECFIFECTVCCYFGFNSSLELYDLKILFYLTFRFAPFVWPVLETWHLVVDTW